jgi:hypothetical protein
MRMALKEEMTQTRNFGTFRGKAKEKSPSEKESKGTTSFSTSEKHVHRLALRRRKASRETASEIDNGPVEGMRCQVAGGLHLCMWESERARERESEREMRACRRTSPLEENRKLDTEA